MTRDVYMFDISHSDDAKMLHSTRKEALADETLSLMEVAEIIGAVDARFAWLNSRTFGGQTGRWN